jgi:hypothetical protein
MSAPTAWTVAELRRHLQAACQLELTTIPPYLTALYSLKPDSNLEAALILRSVVVEEMLHLTLAANVLNAVGGRPRVNGTAAPRYPAALPYHDPPTFEVGIRPMSGDALNVFLAIENPSYPVTTPPAASADAVVPLATALAREHGYATIGEFYKAIEKALRALGADGTLFSGDPARQVGPENYYASGGKIIDVHDLDDALEALDQIVEQGEGELTLPPSPEEKFDPDRDLAHYYRFNELKLGRRYRKNDAPAAPTGAEIALDEKEIYPMAPNWRPAADSGELAELAAAGDRIYGRLLDRIQIALDGRPEELPAAVATMWDLKDAAVDLLRIPLPDGDGLHAGPTFRYPGSEGTDG